jgi:hypothetical protein
VKRIRLVGIRINFAVRSGNDEDSVGAEHSAHLKEELIVFPYMFDRFKTYDGIKRSIGCGQSQTRPVSKAQFIGSIGLTGIFDDGGINIDADDTPSNLR